jgi:F420-dependent oxidoreductase-like protein
MTRLGLQIPNFTYPGVPDAELFERVAAQAAHAESVGFDTVLVMDHFYQLPALGPPDHYMLEAYTLLGALAARTRSARLATLVSGNTYRNPALLAKMVTTLDVISGGRAMLGVGAGWFEPEHQGYGFDFPPLGERLDRLEEALAIMHPMLRGKRPTLEGRFYRASDAINSPAPLSPGGPPILIGGTGEKRTLRLVARYADESNWTCAPEEFPRKLEALERHCQELGRDRGEIQVTWLGSVVIAPSVEEAEGLRNEYLAARGMVWENLPEHLQEMIRKALVVGGPDEVGEFVQQKVLGQGLDGIVVNLPARGWELETVSMAAETLKKALGD